MGSLSLLTAASKPEPEPVLAYKRKESSPAPSNGAGLPLFFLGVLTAVPCDGLRHASIAPYAYALAACFSTAA